jgi:hypothetical protein
LPPGGRAAVLVRPAIFLMPMTAAGDDDYVGWLSHGWLALLGEERPQSFLLVKFLT